MATDDPIRASDSDREVVVAALRDAYTAGRITMDEFDERMSAAYAAKTWGDLRKLTIDLPSQPILGGDVPGRRFASAMAPDRQPSDRQPEAPLPSHPPRANLRPSRSRRPRHRAALIIPLLVWVLIVVRADTPGSNGAVLAVIVIMAVVALLAATRRR
jgi:hypothetical protein